MHKHKTIESALDQILRWQEKDIRGLYHKAFRVSPNDDGTYEIGGTNDVRFYLEEGYNAYGADALVIGYFAPDNIYIVKGIELVRRYMPDYPWKVDHRLSKYPPTRIELCTRVPEHNGFEPWWVTESQQKKKQNDALVATRRALRRHLLGA